MQVFKFGGASVKNAEAIRNVAHIIKNFGTPTHLVVVVSAMGKTTNALESLLYSYLHKRDWQRQFQEIYHYHKDIVENLFPKNHLIFKQIEKYFSKLQETLLQQTDVQKYDESYDQVISFGEIIATQIVSCFLQEQNITNQWIDIRSLLKTDTTWREAKVDFTQTEQLLQKELLPILKEKVVVTQGFIGGTFNNKTTTLGREGSDYTASIIAYALNAQKVIIWKDVPGILNADPKKVLHTQLYPNLSYNQAAEMTFYGAKVIHPKTIKPIANKGIPLYVRSFVEPEKAGTCISNQPNSSQIPTIIFKYNQLLLQFSVKDLAFITEENLVRILNVFTKVNAKINLLQNSALSLWIATDFYEQKIRLIYTALSTEFTITQTSDLQMITIMNYNSDLLKEVLSSFDLVLEQKYAQTYRVLVREKSYSCNH